MNIFLELWLELSRLKACHTIRIAAIGLLHCSVGYLLAVAILLPATAADTIQAGGAPFMT
jgi:hypothetical protein